MPKLERICAQHAIVNGFAANSLPGPGIRALLRGMSRRAERREEERREALIKLGIAAVACLALAIGGFQGFKDALLLLLAVGCVLVVGMLGCILIFKSPISIARKIGLYLLLPGLFSGLLWWYLTAPVPWKETSATVKFVRGTRAQLVLHTSPFPKLFDLAVSDAEGLGPNDQITVWVNPRNGSEISRTFRSHDGRSHPWLLATALLCTVGAVLLQFVRVPPLATTAGRSGPSPRSPNADSLRSEGPAAPSPGHEKHRPPPGTASVSTLLRSIDWYQFESIAARILEFEGWSVQRSGGANPDDGADLIATNDGCKAVVQCKHWRSFEVQPKVIRELIGTQRSARFTAQTAILFTLSPCTSAATACAEENGVVLYTVDEIEAAIARHGLENFPELLNPDQKTCPKCDARMVLRNKNTRPFWGCSRFPRCRGTIEVAPE
jgi:restriction system protein